MRIQILILEFKGLRLSTLYRMTLAPARQPVQASKNDIRSKLLIATLKTTNSDNPISNMSYLLE